MTKEEGRMEITVGLGTALEERMRAAAARQGITVEAYVRGILEHAVPGLPAPRDPEAPDLRPACGTHQVEQEVMKPFLRWVRAQRRLSEDGPAAPA
jgi:plasmid stability protein